MVGDAAHPGGAGQGASMAIEDALALAAVLQAQPITTAALKAARWLDERGRAGARDYESLRRWSLEEPALFWQNSVSSREPKCPRGRTT
ncbi:hypothetical protein [Streptomyces sp. NPDC002133]|uniref:hypothetical protein n=1 Tax=Streptomyces sp. NPDC002133 TaxID=3154409 RepID=UPI00332DDD24